MSQSATPLLYQVIPVIDQITIHLQDTIEDEAAIPAIRAAAQKGLATLNKYYAKTDEVYMTRMAISK